MAELRKCDECACQGICKIEEKYRSLSQSIDELNDIAKKDSYFHIENLICHRFIRQQPVSRTNNFEEALHFNNMIGEANKNGRA